MTEMIDEICYSLQDIAFVSPHSSNQLKLNENIQRDVLSLLSRSVLKKDHTALNRIIDCISVKLAETLSKPKSDILGVLKLIESCFSIDLPQEHFLTFIRKLLLGLFSIISLFLAEENYVELHVDVFDQSVFILSTFLENVSGLQEVSFIISNDSDMKASLLEMCSSLQRQSNFLTQEVILEIACKLFAMFLKTKKMRPLNDQIIEDMLNCLPTVVKDSLCDKSGAGPRNVLRDTRSILNRVNENNLNLTTVQTRDVFFVEQTKMALELEHKLPFVQWIDMGVEKITFRSGDIAECRISYGDIRHIQSFPKARPPHAKVTSEAVVKLVASEAVVKLT